MAGIRIRVDDEGVKLTLDRKISALEREGLLEVLGEKQLANIDEIFDDEGSPPGSWRLLNASSIIESFNRRNAGQTSRVERNRRGRSNDRAAFTRFARGKKILTDTARLRRSIDKTVSGSQVEIGTNVRYGRIHQLGGVIRAKNAKALRIPLGNGAVIFRKSVKIPARPYLMFRPQDPASLAAAGEDYLAGAGR